MVQTTALHLKARQNKQAAILVTLCERAVKNISSLTRPSEKI